MATITGYTLNDRPRHAQSIVSDEAQAADVVEMVSGVGDRFPIELVHVFVAVKFYDSGDLPVTPSAGTLAVEVQTAGNQPNWEDPPTTTIDATAPTTLDWSANTYGIRVTPTGLTGVDHWVVVVYFNKT